MQKIKFGWSFPPRLSAQPGPGLGKLRFFAIAVFLLSWTAQLAAQAPAPTANFTATPPVVDLGGSSDLSWSTKDATSVTIDSTVRELSGVLRVRPERTTTYILVATGPGGTVTVTASVTVDPRNPQPPEVSFSATPSTIVQGGNSILIWSTTNAERLTINTKEEAVNGEQRVEPTETTTYTLIATGAGGTTTVTLTVNVGVPPLVNFTATPSEIFVGDSSILAWSTKDATSVTINGNDEQIDGELRVEPSVTTLYTLVATGPGGSTSRAVTVKVNPRPPAIVSFTATPSTIVEGDKSILSWSTTDATGVTVNDKEVAVNGQLEVTPTVTTTYTLVATGPGGSTQKTATVTVTPRPPTIESFTATPSTIPPGESSILRWSTKDATSVLINDKEEQLSGELRVTPTVTTTYTLTARGPGGTVTANATVTVGSLPLVNFTATPPTIAPGQSSILAWSTKDADKVLIDDKEQPLSGELRVAPTVTTTFTLIATGPGGSTTATATVTVGRLPLVSFTATPSTILPGESSVLTWSTKDATKVLIDDKEQQLEGELRVAPTVTTTFTLVATGPGGTTSATATVTVGRPPLVSFTANPTTILQGESSILAWSTKDATSVIINDKEQQLSGELRVTPAVTTTFTLVVTGPGGTTTATATVTVGRPPLVSFTATPSMILPGESSVLSWSTKDATSVIINEKEQPLEGELRVAPAVTTTFTLIATGPGGTTTANATVTVGNIPAPTILSFTASPSSIKEGEGAELSWSTKDAEKVTIDNGVGSVELSGATRVGPRFTTTYILTATGPGGTATAIATVRVGESGQPPEIGSFTATPSTIKEGESSELSWSTKGAEKVFIDNGVGSFEPNGSTRVSPRFMTTYTLTATGPGGTAIATTTVRLGESGPPPEIGSFTANPSTIAEGNSSELSWSTKGAEKVFIDNGVGSFEPNGSTRVAPRFSTTYTLMAIGPGGTSSATVKLTVNGAPIIDEFIAEPSSILPPASSTLRWSTRNASSVTITPDLGLQPASGKVEVSPRETTTYLLTATGDGGRATAQLVIKVIAKPEILNFTASPSRVVAGDPVTLLFSTAGANEVSIDQGVGEVGASGSVMVRPTDTTLYTLTARGPLGTVAAQARVEIIKVPSVLVSSFPSGILQTAGFGGGTDRYVLSNVGGGSSTITLGHTGALFTQSPTSFELAAGASQIVTITGEARPAGAYEEKSLVNGAGVPAGLSIPIRLLSTVPPVGTVLAVPSKNRVDTVLPTDTVAIANFGTATLEGILVSDSPWIIPPTGVITIGPGQTVTITFQIDRSKRPDSDALNGSVSGTLSLVYSGPPDAGSVVSRLTSFATTPPPPKTLPIIVVDTAAPVAKAGGIPPLASAEVALVVPGLARSTGVVADLSLVNAAAPVPLSGVQLFYTPSGGSGAVAQSASLKSLLPNLPVSFGDVNGSVFNSAAGSGSLQLRTLDSAKISASASMFSTNNPKGLYGGSVAVFRSDRSASFSEKVFLPGVRVDSRTRSDLYLQETAGIGGTVRTEFLDDRGTIISSRVDTMGQFGVTELKNAVPAGTVSAVVTNMSSGGAKFVAHALMVDQATGDITNIVDWNRRNATSSAEAQIIPLAQTSSESPRSELTIMNSGTTAATGTLTFHTPGGGRQRGTRRPSLGGSSSRFESMSITTSSVTLEPGQTQVVSDVVGAMAPGGKADSGYVVFTPSQGNFAITSRAYAPGSGAAGDFGTGVPILAASSALKAGDSRKIGGLEDAATSSVTARKPGTFRTGFALIESLGKSVTVRVTLRYAANIPGGLADVRATATKEYNLSPRQVMAFSEVGKEIFGASRQSLGDLHNIQLDVDVVAGDGAIIPFTVSTENGTGDSIMRIE